MHLERRLRRIVFGTARAAANLGKKLHSNLRRTRREPQLNLFFNLLQNSPTYGRVARVAQSEVHFERELSLTGICDSGDFGRRVGISTSSPRRLLPERPTKSGSGEHGAFFATRSCARTVPTTTAQLAITRITLRRFDCTSLKLQRLTQSLRSSAFITFKVSRPRRGASRRLASRPTTHAPRPRGGDRGPRRVGSRAGRRKLPSSVDRGPRRVGARTWWQERREDAARRKKRKSADEGLRRLRPALHVAQEVGAMLGRGDDVFKDV